MYGEGWLCGSAWSHAGPESTVQGRLCTEQRVLCVDSQLGVGWRWAGSGWQGDMATAAREADNIQLNVGAEIF